MKRQSFYRQDEVKIYGVNSAAALFKARPQDIIKVYLSQARLQLFSHLIQFCVKNRKAYKIVKEPELEKLTESVHHEGICVLAKDLPKLSFEDLVAQGNHKLKSACLIYLDGVQNPHNIGNILRLCAHFGIAAVLVEERHLQILPPSARRVSEGGSELVPMVQFKNAAADLQKLKDLGFLLCCTSSHAAKSLYECNLQPRTVFVLGSEVSGVSKKIADLCNQNIIIPGTGQVESLNVASACAILASEYWRRII